MSNTRKPKNSRRRSGSRRDEQIRGRRVSQDELHEQFAVMRAVDAAEALGDAEAAAAIIDSMPDGPDGKPFWRPWRLRRLAQLIELQDVLPRWAVSRWILGQALQQLDDASRDRGKRALQIAVDVRGGEERLPGVDHIDAQCKVIDHDWVYRQQYLYDLGGLRHFLRTAASVDLVTGADRIADWASVAMGGYRLQAVASGALVWEDLSSGRTRQVLDLGSAALVAVGDCVIGRVVPIDGGEMFESSPLSVAEEVARRVSENPRTWVDVLTPWVREYTEREGEAHARALLAGAHDFGLLTDVPEVLWRTLFEAPDGPTARLSQNPTAVIADAVGFFELVATTADPDYPEMNRVWPWVAAVLVVPRVVPVLAHRLGPGHAQALHRVADRLTEPAATLCRGLAEACREAS